MVILKFIITIKPTALLYRIKQLNKYLEDIRYDSMVRIDVLPFNDVIEDITRDEQ